jgi:putative tryptophan/tyrosine transport system substrate-binding protein
MRRRDFMMFVGGAVAAGPFAAMAQELGRTYRLGIFFPVRLEPPDAVAALFDELKRAGFIEGKNLTIEFRAYAPHPERMSEYAAELVKDGPDIIFADGTSIPALQEVARTGLRSVRSMAALNGSGSRHKA